MLRNAILSLRNFSFLQFKAGKPNPSTKKMKSRQLEMGCFYLTTKCSPFLRLRTCLMSIIFFALEIPLSSTPHKVILVRNRGCFFHHIVKYFFVYNDDNRLELLYIADTIGAKIILLSL